MNVSVVVIAGGKRTALIDEQILPSLTDFEDVLVVGAHHEGKGFRYFHVPDLTKSTNDALTKRDVGTLAAKGDVIVYLSDDHKLGPNFRAELEQMNNEGVVAWDVLVPSRWAQHPEQGRIRIPNGEQERYCGGHSGVFRKHVVEHRPWTAHQHHPNWDLISSHEHLRAGYKYVTFPRLEIEDLEPHAMPWR